MTVDPKPDDVLRLEHLLYGYNYSVWLNVYGPLDAALSLEEALRSSVSLTSMVGGSRPVDVSEVREHVLESLLYPGDAGSGPEDLAGKRAEIAALAEKLLQSAQVDKADAVSAFWFAKGHPAYPVFWAFAYDVHALGKRWILLGSSSD